jgi:crotonobetainyl-CoA:carnitine CoA-transferase CaiB-like acyl-CoA transferase
MARPRRFEKALPENPPLADPHLKAREMIVDVDYPTRGTYQTVPSRIKRAHTKRFFDHPPLAVDGAFANSECATQVRCRHL